MKTDNNLINNYENSLSKEEGFYENQDFLNIDVKESFTENRRDFLNNLKSFETTKGKNEENSNINFPNKMKKNNTSSILKLEKMEKNEKIMEKSDKIEKNLKKNEKSLKNIEKSERSEKPFERNENNQLKLPRNLLSKGDFSIKSAISNSPETLSHLKAMNTPNKGKFFFFFFETYFFFWLKPFFSFLLPSFFFCAPVSFFFLVPSFFFFLFFGATSFLFETRFFCVQPIFLYKLPNFHKNNFR